MSDREEPGTVPAAVPGAPGGFLIPEALRTDLLRIALESVLIGPLDPNAPKPPPPSWRTRLRRKRDDWRARLAGRAFRIIAGYWPSEPGGDW